MQSTIFLRDCQVFSIEFCNSFSLRMVVRNNCVVIIGWQVSGVFGLICLVGFDLNKRIIVGIEFEIGYQIVR